MVRTIVLGLVTLLALAGTASACPYGKTAETTTDQQQTSDSSSLPLPTPGSTDGTTTTETKTGG
jgi:hypothetical protein